MDSAKELGFITKAGSELEYFIFQNSFHEAAKNGYTELKPAGWYVEDYYSLQGIREEHFNGAVRRHLRVSGIPVEISKGEAALGSTWTERTLCRSFNDGRPPGTLQTVS